LGAFTGKLTGEFIASLPDQTGMKHILDEQIKTLKTSLEEVKRG
jgi:hypothetical protein